MQGQATLVHHRPIATFQTFAFSHRFSSFTWPIKWLLPMYIESRPSLLFNCSLQPSTDPRHCRCCHRRLLSLLHARTCIALLEASPGAEIGQEFTVVPFRIDRLNETGRRQEHEINSCICDGISRLGGTEEVRGALIRAQNLRVGNRSGFRMESPVESYTMTAMILIQDVESQWNHSCAGSLCCTLLCNEIGFPID